MSYPSTSLAWEIREITPARLETASLAMVDVPSGVGHGTARSSRSEKTSVCMKGQLSFVVKNEAVSLEPMEVLHVPKHAWFSYRNAGSDQARLLLMHIPPFHLASEEFKDASPGKA